MASRDVVQRTFDWLGSNGRFTRNSATLTKQSDDVCAVVALQRSDLGPSYYINVGFGLRQLHGQRIEGIGQCDIRVRIERLLGDPGLAEFLDLQNDLDESVREAALRRPLGDRLTRIVDQALTIGGLAGLLQSGRLKQAFVAKGARERFTKAESA